MKNNVVTPSEPGQGKALCGGTRYYFPKVGYFVGRVRFEIKYQAPPEFMWGSDPGCCQVSSQQFMNEFTIDPDEEQDSRCRFEGNQLYLHKNVDKICSGALSRTNTESILHRIVSGCFLHPAESQSNSILA